MDLGDDSNIDPCRNRFIGSTEACEASTDNDKVMRVEFGGFPMGGWGLRMCRHIEPNGGKRIFIIHHCFDTWNNSPMVLKGETNTSYKKILK
jgi:hypothetical protein